MLEQFTVETFSGRVGETFDVDLGDETYALVLAECTELGSSPIARTPFSLVFTGAPERVLEQRIYPLRHDALGAFDLFLVPIGQDADATRYEAVFT